MYKLADISRENVGCTALIANIDLFYIYISSFVFKTSLTHFYNAHIIYSTRQATACVCWSVEIRECAGTHCLMELAGGVVQRNLKPA